MKRAILAKRRHVALRRIEAKLGTMPSHCTPQIDMLFKLEFMADKLEEEQEEQKEQEDDDTE